MATERTAESVTSVRLSFLLVCNKMIKEILAKSVNSINVA